MFPATVPGDSLSGEVPGVTTRVTRDPPTVTVAHVDKYNECCWCGCSLSPMDSAGRSVLLRVVLGAALASALVTSALAVFATPRAALAQPLDWVITADALGLIEVGSTVDEVAPALPAGYQLGDTVPLAPDLSGRVVSIDGAVQALLPIADDVVTTIIVLGDSYRTADGIGPGTLITDAEAVYGALRRSVGVPRTKVANGSISPTVRPD